MKTTLILASAAAALLAIAAPASAQTETTTTVTRTTTTTVVPDTVRTYVVGQPAPASVVVEGPVVIGEALPEIVSITPIPDNADYGYAVVNDQRVLIDPRSRTVIEVLN